MSRSRVPSLASKAFVTKKRGKATPPVSRVPSSGQRALSPAELLQERFEERSLRRAWDEGRIPSTLKG